MNEIEPIILAAGRGSRLGVENMPKPMVPIGNRPMMQNAVETLFNMGFGTGDIRAVIGFNGEVVSGYFGTDLQYVLQEHLNGNAGALEAALEKIDEFERRDILAIQGDDAFQATKENVQNLIHTHISRESDVSILTINVPDVTTHKNEYMYDGEGRILQVIPRVTKDSHGSYMAGIFMFSGRFLSDYLPKVKESIVEGGEMGISQMIKFAVLDNKKVYHCYSNVPYVAVNNPIGLQRLRDRSNS